uniref:Two-component response regulator ARR12-like n=1 Tax=Nicotiana tabacum TaxID=4097 RepID=A0A1S3XW72_TOBAC
MRMGSLDGLGGFRTLAGSGRYGQASLSSSYASGGMLGRLNYPAGVSLHSLASSPLLQPNHGQSLSNSINSFTKLNPNAPPVSQNASLFHGIPTSLELDQLHELPTISRLPQDRVRENSTSAGPYLPNNTVDFPSSTIVSLPFEALRGETQCLESLGDGVQIMNQAYCQWWPDQNQHYSQNSNHIFGNMSSQVSSNGGVASLPQSMDQNNEVVYRGVDVSLIGRSNGGSSALIQHSPDSRTRTREDYLLETTKQQVGFIPQGYGSLDDLMSAMKRVRRFWCRSEKRQGEEEHKAHFVAQVRNSSQKRNLVSACAGVAGQCYLADGSFFSAEARDA